MFYEYSPYLVETKSSARKHFITQFLNLFCINFYFNNTLLVLKDIFDITFRLATRTRGDICIFIICFPKKCRSAAYVHLSD